MLTKTAISWSILLQPLLKMFGYKKGEIEGKNVSLLMPQPFSNKHNSFLRNYTTTGKAKILNTNREVGCCCGCQKQLYVGVLDCIFDSHCSL